MTSKTDLLNSKIQEALKGGGDKRIESQHKKGKLTIPSKFLSEAACVCA